MPDPLPEQINPDIISAARTNPVLRQIIELYLHRTDDPDNTVPITYQQTLELAVVKLAAMVDDYRQVATMHGVKRREDILLLKDALVNEDARKQIGGALRAHRLDKGWTLEQAAHLADGVNSTSVLSMVERGVQNFHIDTLMKYAESMGLKISIAALKENDGQTT